MRIFGTIAGRCVQRSMWFHTRWMAVRRPFHHSWRMLNEAGEEDKIEQIAAKIARIKVPKANKMPPRPKINENEIEEKFIKGGSGKGGQKINKTNSKVQLTHIPTGIVVTSQATRSRDQNRKIAREILAQKIQDQANPDTSRSAMVILRKQARKSRAKRKTRKKYRLLDSEDDTHETNDK
ncbi:unnamed protein product [Kuraishia capsulata CBS 1993]|uniref:Prokaryotic-type class I peptide chain release factors domain-containing protein n=1 Tax=Kuraishia capsulata CBS 1993 TaxID=1382522 RepID=W6MPQ8_9ASCO|nr:uncharacterized protein KUCA_T00004300001 [Kuraishia capsulata CBS 1993]CDK28318.1 unnamed protein product [Kuraishia capsulata CBS 1993]